MCLYPLLLRERARAQRGAPGCLQCRRRPGRSAEQGGTAGAVRAAMQSSHAFPYLSQAVLDVEVELLDGALEALVADGARGLVRFPLPVLDAQSTRPVGFDPLVRLQHDKPDSGHGKRHGKRGQHRNETGAPSRPSSRPSSRPRSPGQRASRAAVLNKKWIPVSSAHLPAALRGAVRRRADVARARGGGVGGARAVRRPVRRPV